MLLLLFVSALGTTSPKSGAKLLLFFELTKFFGKDLQNEKVLIISANEYYRGKDLQNRRGKLTSNSQIYQV
ncbi:MAG: hypothetical protein IKO66_07965 [Paludibacteraceae bacterium]|nr:hypothetical protein [Paludibacteraceae bacterium]